MKKLLVVAAAAVALLGPAATSASAGTLGDVLNSIAGNAYGGNAYGVDPYGLQYGAPAGVGGLAGSGLLSGLLGGGNGLLGGVGNGLVDENGNPLPGGVPLVDANGNPLPGALPVGYLPGYPGYNPAAQPYGYPGVPLGYGSAPLSYAGSPYANVGYGGYGNGGGYLPVMNNGAYRGGCNSGMNNYRGSRNRGHHSRRYQSYGNFR